jgi:hypothetical protein
MSLLLLFQSEAGGGSNTNLSVTKADLEPLGQDIALQLTWSSVVTAAALEPTGQDVTLTATDILAILVEAAGIQPIGQVIGLVNSTPQEAESSGGFFFRQEQERYRREYERERERKELQELEERLEAHLVETGSIPKPDVSAEVRRLRAQVESFRDREGISNRLTRALDYAQKARTEIAYRLAAREIAKMMEEEELALLMVLLTD